MAAAPLIEIKDLTLGFKENDTHIIDHLSLDLHVGEVLALVGPSGSGKTLLAKTLLGIQPATAKIQSGQIHFTYENTSFNLLELSDSEKTNYRKNWVAMIFQNPGTSLNPSLKIRRQLKAIDELSVNNKTKEDQTYISLLEKLGFEDSERILNAFPHQLSGGQLQRIIIGMTMIKGPKLWIADEPTTALDIHLRDSLMDLILKTKKEMGASLLYISHDLQSVEKIADRIAFIENGRIVEIGEKQSIFDQPSSKVGQTLVQLFRKHQSFNFKKEQQLLPDLLSFKNVHKSYIQKSFLGLGKRNEIKVLDYVNFVIKKGEILGLVGPSGSGKTTIASLILGLEQADSGEICYLSKVDNESIEAKREFDSNRTIQGVFQNPIKSLTPQMTVQKLLSEAILLHQPDLSKGEVQQKAFSLLSEFDLPSELLKRYPHQLSGGECQRICIARAMAMQPELLVCDEITSSLDVINQQKIMDYLLRIREKYQLSILYISHDLGLVAQICDRILEIEDGSVKVLDSLQPFEK